MQWKKSSIFVLTILGLTGTALVATGTTAFIRDLWIHPRGEAFDPALHYKAPNGEIVFHSENDLGKGLDSIVVQGGNEPRITADLGPDLWRFVRQHQGALDPVVLYDSDGDGRVDKSVRGAVLEDRAIFAGAHLAEVDWRNGTWQMGVRYVAGENGLRTHDGRFLASVDSKNARVQYPRVDDLPVVSAGPGAGLSIFKHQEGAPFDLNEMARRPNRYIEDFYELTPEKDADDWTVGKKRRGKLRTHLDREDLILVRTHGNAALAVEWGDMPLEQFMRERLAVSPDADGCFNTLESRVVGDDDVHAPVPHRILYCPHASMALFDAPDGYEIGLTALQDEIDLEYTEASTSILDNVRLYAREVYKRSPRRRATGSVTGNLRESFKDSGRDVVDMGRHLVTGTTQRNIHTGQMERRTSLFAAVPKLIQGIVTLDPIQGGKDFIEGVGSGVQVAADVVSAVHNGVINPLIQTTVGLASPQVADTAGHWTGALTQAWSKNLPGSERSLNALSPFSLWYHDRAFAPTEYTRTDTQLNIDRVFTIANIFGVWSLASGGGGSGDGGSGDGVAVTTRRHIPARPSPAPASVWRFWF